MNLLVKEAMGIGKLRNASLLAGRSGLENEISLVTVMDVPGIINWLRGGEMLLAAELFASQVSRDFLLGLKSKSVSAVITKPAYVAGLTDELATLCDELQLPIILVSPDSSWGEITEPIMQLIARRQYEAIYQSQQFHGALMRSMIQKESLNTLCQKIYDTTSLTIALADASYMLLGASENIDWSKVLDGLSIYNTRHLDTLTTNTTGTSTSGYAYSNLFLDGIGKKLFIYPVIQNQMLYGNILLVVNRSQENLDVTDSMKVEQLALLLALDVSKSQESNNALRRFRNLLLDQMLSDGITTDLERQRIEQLLNRPLHASYYITLVEGPHAQEQNIYVQGRRVSALFDALYADKTDFPDILCFERSNYLVFFIPGNESYIGHAVQKLHAESSRILGQRQLYVGVSNPTSLSQLSKAFQQSVQALRFLQTVSGKPIGFYRDLGILRYFIDHAGNLDELFLQEVHDRYLKRLQEYDAKHNTLLEKTLTLFIHNNFSHSKTGDELYIHKNTLRARMLKIEEILECSLRNQEDLFNIQLALKIDHYQKYVAKSIH